MSFQFSQNTPLEDRVCESCGATFQIDSDPMFKRFVDCDVCEEERSEKAAKAAYEAERRVLWEAAVPAVYRATRTDHPDYPRDIHKLSLAWNKGVAISEGEHRLFLGLIGESGKCKTRVISQLVKRIIWDGGTVLWLNSSQFQWACQNQFGADAKEAGDWLKRYRAAPVLVFDDIGSLKASEVVSDNLYALLEHRTAIGLPMLWTSNETLSEMLAGGGGKAISEKARKRNLSRLGGFSNIIQL